MECNSCGSKINCCPICGEQIPGEQVSQKKNVMKVTGDSNQSFQDISGNPTINISNGGLGQKIATPQYSIKRKFENVHEIKNVTRKSLLVSLVVTMTSFIGMLSDLLGLIAIEGIRKILFPIMYISFLCLAIAAILDITLDSLIKQKFTTVFSGIFRKVFYKEEDSICQISITGNCPEDHCEGNLHFSERKIKDQNGNIVDVRRELYCNVNPYDHVYLFDHTRLEKKAN